MSWLGQVGSCRVPDDDLVWMRPATTEFGGSGGGLGRGGQVQVASLTCANRPKFKGWGLGSSGSVMRCLAVTNINTNANPLARLEVLGGGIPWCGVPKSCQGRYVGV